RWGRAQWLMLLVFASTVLAWVFGSLIADWLQISTGYDAAVALLALIALHAFGLAPWRAIAERTDWGVLLLFGGGLTLSLVLESSGAGAWLASLLAGPFTSMPVVLSLMLLVLFAMALTEVASNTASAALLIPLFIGLAPQIDSVAMAMLIALGTSCAFLLPVATPPNAIIFGSGQVPQRAMLRSGLWVSAAILPLLFALVALFALGLSDVL
ncbi:MAG: anion permease, partial [Chromatiaceae bacterium]|nr:anion permease [Chromatiaceae bacterium]